MNPENERYKELPMRYHSAYPLFNPHSSPAAGAAQGAGGSCLGYPTALYKAVDQMDSQLYTLRRFDNVRTSNNVITNVAQRWHEVRHPGVVALYGIALEKGALFFSYMYHAGAQTLKERYIDQRGPLLGEYLHDDFTFLCHVVGTVWRWFPCLAAIWRSSLKLFLVSCPFCVEPSLRVPFVILI
jgi:hypothetical protein